MHLFNTRLVWHFLPFGLLKKTMKKISHGVQDILGNATIFKILWNICFVSLEYLNCYKKGHWRFYHAQIIVPSVEDFCQMYAWIVEVILRLVNPTKDGLIITFCGVRNKSSGIFHSKWKCKLFYPRVKRFPWNSFCVYIFRKPLPAASQWF